MDWLTAQPFAHRGLHGAGIPENSMAAFEAALAGGYGIELDVRLLADGAVAVFHDRSLERLAGRDGLIERLTVPTMKPLRLAGTEQPIPLLADVLTLLSGRVPVYIELKQEARVGPLERAVCELLSGYSGPFSVCSFSPWSLAWFACHAPHMVRGQIATRKYRNDVFGIKRFFYGGLRCARFARPDFVAYDLRHLPDPAVARARAAGLPVLAWTVTSQDAMHYAYEHADNAVFEGFIP